MIIAVEAKRWTEDEGAGGATSKAFEGSHEEEGSEEEEDEEDEAQRVVAALAERDEERVSDRSDGRRQPNADCTTLMTLNKVSSSQRNDCSPRPDTARLPNQRLR